MVMVEVTERIEIARLPGMEITRAQCRAARVIVNMSQEKLAQLSGLSRSTICDFEANRRMVSRRALHEIRIALERRGIAFDDNGGLRLLPTKGRRGS